MDNHRSGRIPRLQGLASLQALLVLPPEHVQGVGAQDQTQHFLAFATLLVQARPVPGAMRQQVQDLRHHGQLVDGEEG